MSKLEETNLLIDGLIRLEERGLKVDNAVILADIAKSMAIIADKLCGAESEEEAMTYEDIYNEFCEKFPNSGAEDYRPAAPLFIPQLMRDIPNGIIVWLKDGSEVVYIAESEDK